MLWRAYVTYRESDFFKIDQKDEKTSFFHEPPCVQWKGMTSIKGDIKERRPGFNLTRPPLTIEQRKQKKKLTRIVILVCICLIPLFVWFQSALFNNAVSLPINSNILIFALINANVLLVLLVLFLVLRNLAELFFERRQNLLGTKLKTKLVVSFISLSLIPTILLFFILL